MTEAEMKVLHTLNKESALERSRIREMESALAGQKASIGRCPIDEKTAIRYKKEIEELKASSEQRLGRILKEYDRLCRAIDEIPDSELRLILSLRYVNDLPWRQIGFSIGMTEDAVRKRASRFFDGDRSRSPGSIGKKL